MASPSSSPFDVGFDVAGTRDALLNWLVKAGACTCADVAPTPGASLTPEQVGLFAWRRAADAAMIHANLHGVPAEVGDGDGGWSPLPGCAEAPCKKAGASFALLELCDHIGAELPTAFANAMSQVADHMARLDPSVLMAIEESAKTMLSGMATAFETSRQAAQSRGSAASFREFAGTAQMWQGLLELGLNVTQAYRGTMTLAGDLHSVVGRHASVHRPPPEPSHGRARQTLLAAVLQALKDGGFTYGEIEGLVVGMAGGVISTTAKARKGQIRQRIRGEDVRSIRPFDDESTALKETSESDATEDDQKV